MNQKDIASKVFVYLKLIREVDLFRYGKSYIAVTAGLFTYSSSQEGYIPAKMYGPRAQLLAYFKPEDEIIIEGYFTKINDEYEIIIEAVSSFRLDKIDRKKGQERLEKAAKVKARFPDVVCLLRSEADPLKRQIPRIENTDIELSQVSLSDEWVILGTPRLNPEDLLYATYYYQVDVGYEEQVEDDVSEQECEQESEQELEKASKQEQVDQEESNEESNYELIKLLQSLEESEQELEKASKQEQVDQEESNEESNYELIKLLQSLEESEQELEKASKQEQVNQEESNQELLQSLGESELQLEKEQVNQEESNQELLQSLGESELQLEKEQVKQEESNQELLQSLGEPELQLEKEQVKQEEFNQELLQSLGEPELQLEKEQVNQEESNQELLQSLGEPELQLEKEQVNQEQINQEEFNQELLQSLGESELQLEKEQVNQEESNQEQVKEQESDPEEAERRKFLEEKQKLLEQFFLIFQLIDFHMYEEEMSRPKKELLDDLFEEDFQIYYNGGWHKLT
uniref:Uncharacterized protein n=1 Tax=Cyanidioschyzon merolae (strain NIES-3377 / 10D) TaxID=280699 RepID=Q85FP3_CYAM1|nr:ORF515 [Cyanidioschyzon merolae strain 10D]BAC76302.1 unnamed protein product [Cyanidioschyzon merolae strain 10D]